MKKTSIFIIAIVCILAFCACDSLLGNSTDQGGEPLKKNEYTVAFATDGGTPVASMVVKPGTKCDTPSATTKAGYEFVGWYFGDRLWDFEKNTVNMDVTLTAKWKVINYSIIYDLAGGNYVGILPKTYNVESETILLPNLTKEGCTFAGWYDVNGKLISEIAKGTTENITLFADFYGPEATVIGSDSASVRTWDNDNNITVKLTDTSSTSLTVKVHCTKPWDTVKITIGNAYKYAQTYMEGDKLMFDIKMTANSDNAVVTPVVLQGDNYLSSSYGMILADGTKVDKNYYPGFVRKAVTFTIDDGNLAMDEKFINIVKPAGIKGTFNLCNTNAASAVKYLTLYEGYEVANHHQLHCLPWRDGFDFSQIEIKNEIFSSSTADVNYMYITEIPGLYYIDYKQFSSNFASPYWHPIATNETYIQYVDITKSDIEKVFGEGAVVGFAYPHGNLNAEVKQYLMDAGYLYARKTGVLTDTTRFSLPEDRFEWTYNATETNLLSVMAKYDAYGDDGELKFFSFGVHSSDYKNSWDVLTEFAETYGNRPDDFWYASNREIFEYEDAVEALEIYDDRIVNPSNVDVFVTINNVKTLICANTVYYL